MLIVLAIFSSFTVSAETEYTVSNTSPAITWETSSALVLANYSVVFDGDTQATSDVEWYIAGDLVEEGVTVFENPGVYPVVAKSGSKEKTVYCVISESLDSEHVLYEADFSQYHSLDELKGEGWEFLNGADRYSLTEGNLVIGSTADGYARAILPEWLGDFGDYSITAEAKMLSTTDSGRWFGLVYRIQNQNSQYYPYYHMCLRENTTAASGIEFAERTTSNAWNVASKTSGDIASLKDGFHTFNIQAYGTDVQYNIDGKEELYITDAIIGKSTGMYEKGMIGLTMNYGTIAIKSIKVTVQKNTPERPEIKLSLVNNNHDALNLINPIANVQSVSDASMLENGNVGIALFNAGEVESISETIKSCVKNKTIPTFYVSSVKEADLVVASMFETECNDVTIISESAEALKHARSRKTAVRTGLVADLKKSEITSDEAHEIRASVRSAPATFCVINGKYASKQVVSELQEMAIAVWVTVESEPDTAEYTVEALRAVTSGANGIISKSASKLAETVNAYLASDSMTRTPIMIGHRGNPSQAPENSLSGFLAAYANGADVFEIDVEITQDGEIIIMHDNTLNRTTNYTGAKVVNQMTLEEIKSYNLKALDGSISDEKVPTLREVLDEFKDKDCKIFVEFKGGNAQNVPVALAIVKEMGMEDKVDVISFNANFLTSTQAEIVGMSTGYLLSVNGSATTVEDAIESFYKTLLTVQGRNSTINPANGIMTNYFAQVATDRGMTVWPWTYTSASNNYGFLSGCDGVTTDDMQWVTDMAKYMKSVGAAIGLGAELEPVGTYVTYGGEEIKVSGKELIVKLIDGEEFVEYDDSKFVGKKAGKATVMYGYKAKTTDGSPYVIYSQPVEILVLNPENALADKAEAEDNDPTLIIAISIIVVTILAGAIAIVIILKKKESTPNPEENTAEAEETKSEETEE